MSVKDKSHGQKHNILAPASTNRLSPNHKTREMFLRDRSYFSHHCGISRVGRDARSRTRPQYADDDAKNMSEKETMEEMMDDASDELSHKEAQESNNNLPPGYNDSDNE